MTPVVDARVGGLVDHLFRHSAGPMVAALARALGARHLDLAEECVQEAMVRALQTWSYRGVPDDPAAWLFQVARRAAIDRLRRDRTWSGKADLLQRSLEGMTAPPATAADLPDNTLAMMFMCCHPRLPEASRVALTLKTVAGFGVDEIAAALLAAPATVAQRIVRAKRQLADEDIPLEVPGGRGQPERLDAVLRVVYLLFNEGYAAHGGANLVRADLCDEAIRLGRLLARHPHTATPATHALLALMLLHASRLPARTDAMGDLLLLAEQDRVRWDRGLIAAGLAALDRSAAGDTLSAYHLEAGIAACHATASSVEATDWAEIATLYDDLVRVAPSPVVQLNRAIAIGMRDGPATGIAMLEALAGAPGLADYALLPGSLGALWLSRGGHTQAAECFRRALAHAGSEPERRFLEAQLRRAQAAAP